MAILVALVVAVPLTLVTAAPSQAVQEAPGPYDIKGGFDIAPKYIPRWATDYYTSLDRQYGRADKAVVTELANGLGVNGVAAPNSADCTPDPSMGGPALERGAARTDWIDQHCRIHKDTLSINVGSVAAPSDSAAWQLSGSHRLLFLKNSARSDCLSNGTIDDSSDARAVHAVGLRYGQRQETLDFGFLPASGYLCMAQGFTVKATYYEGGTVKMGDYWYKVRGPWTVYKVVGLGDMARPTNIRVQPNGTSMRLTWNYPNFPDVLGNASRNVLRSTRFIVKSDPDSRFCNVVGRNGCVVSGLRPGTAYSFTINVNRRHSSLTTDPTAPVVLGASATSAPATPAPSTSAPATPAPATSAPATPSQSASASSAVTPLTPQLRSLTASTTPQPGGNVRVVSMVTGQLRAGESVGQRTLVVCYSATADGPCTTTNSYQLGNNLMKSTLTFLVPRSAAGGYMSLQQIIAVSPGPGLIGALSVSPKAVSRITS